MAGRFDNSGVPELNAIKVASVRKARGCGQDGADARKMPRELVLALLIMLTAAVILAGHIRDLAQASGLF